MLRRFSLSSLLLSSLCFLAACGPSQQTKQADTDETTDNSARWTETDAKPVVDSMAEDMLQSQWIQRWTKEHEGRPTVSVGLVRNKTMQRIDEYTVIRPVAQRLNRSSKLQLIELTKKERAALRHEPQSMCEPPQFLDREALKEVEADFMVLGTVSSNVPDNQSGDTVSIFYTVTLELLNLDANQKAWHAEKEIKKMVPRSKVNL